MELNRRSALVYVLLAALWLLVMVWQVQEHQRLQNYARTSLRNRSKDIANTLGAFIRGLNFRGAVFGDRLQPVLNELVSSDTNDFFRSGEVVSISLLNAAGEPVASAGNPLDLEQHEILSQGERWGRRTLTMVYPVEGANVSLDGGTNAALVLITNAPPPRFRRPSTDARAADTNRAEPRAAEPARTGPPPPRRDRPPDNRPMRPFWARGLNDQEYQAVISKRELHGLVLGMSTDKLRELVHNDLRTRILIGFLATVAALGSGLAWRNISKSSELQIRLIRASELNTHLKEMNLAAAGLAHETRNPLNIIRGLGQMISREREMAPEVKAKASQIVQEADKVAAQLNEFINYSRPREVRRTVLSLSSVVNEVVRALNYDLDEKKIDLRVTGEQIQVQADEQLLRQALFNLLLNGVQAVDAGGHIEVSVQRTNGEAAVEIRDDGPGVPPEHRQEIFKPYFTTHKEGTGLGLAVVQQIVLAHGWEIDCLSNSPKGAIFRITHLHLPPRA